MSKTEQKISTVKISFQIAPADCFNKPIKMDGKGMLVNAICVKLKAKKAERQILSSEKKMPILGLWDWE